MLFATDGYELIGNPNEGEFFYSYGMPFMPDATRDYRVLRLWNESNEISEPTYVAVRINEFDSKYRQVTPTAIELKQGGMMYENVNIGTPVFIYGTLNINGEKYGFWNSNKHMFLSKFDGETLIVTDEQNKELASYAVEE